MSEPKYTNFKPRWMKEPDAVLSGDLVNGSIPPPDEPALKEVVRLRRYRHRKSQDIYLVSDLIPINDDDQWVDGVLYMHVATTERFAQSVERFKRKFEEVVT